MDQNEKARFILALHKHSLQAFDSGGTVLGGPSTNAVPNAVNPNQGFAGTIGSVLGTNNNFQAGTANVQAGTNQGQLNQAYSGVQQGLSAQKQFANQAAQAGGFNNQNNILNQQQELANQLQQQASGGGPNPAQAALVQNTGQNVANQGALMASARGAASNPGLIAREAAQQGAATQQQAVGQAATLQAQQQLAAQAALANQEAQMQGVAANQIAAQGQGATGLTQGQQGEQGILQGANTAYNNAGVSMQGNINNVNAQTAAANQADNQGIIGGVAQGISSAAGPAFKFLGLADGGEVDAKPPHYPSVQFADGGLTPPSLTTPGPGPQSFIGQWLNSPSQVSSVTPSIGSAPVLQSNAAGMEKSISSAFGAKPAKEASGGEVPITQGKSTPVPVEPMNEKEQLQWSTMKAKASDITDEQFEALKHPDLDRYTNIINPYDKPYRTPGKPAYGEGSQPEGVPKETALAMGGPVNGPQSFAARYLSGHAMPSGASMFPIVLAKKEQPQLAAIGGKVDAQNPSEKAVKKDNSYANDKVPALLSAGEIVIPRSITTHPDAANQAARFVQAVLNKKRLGGK